MKRPHLTLDELIGLDALLEDDERALRDRVRAFITAEATPHIAAHYDAGTFPTDLIAPLAELGLLGGNLSGHGCAGLSEVAWGLACQEVEACDSGLRSFVSVQTSLAMYAIARFGSEDQKRRWLPEMAAGRLIGCFGLTEPNHGSDPASMECRADRTDGGWTLTGRKAWITNAQLADLAVVWARTGDDARSISAFVVERGQAGFDVTDIPQKISMRVARTGHLAFDGVAVPSSHRLAGAEGLGAALKCLHNARYGVAFGVVGAARACAEIAIAEARERRQFGEPLATRQLVQLRLADMACALTQASLHSAQAGRLKQRGALHPAQVSVLKRSNCRMALDVARSARALLGARGITADRHVLRHAVNLESTYTYEGTDEIHTLSIGRALTGYAAF